MKTKITLFIFFLLSIVLTISNDFSEVSVISSWVVALIVMIVLWRKNETNMPKS